MLTTPFKRRSLVKPTPFKQTSPEAPYDHGIPCAHGHHALETPRHPSGHVRPPSGSRLNQVRAAARGCSRAWGARSRRRGPCQDQRRGAVRRHMTTTGPGRCARPKMQMAKSPASAQGPPSGPPLSSSDSAHASPSPPPSSLPSPSSHPLASPSSPPSSPRASPPSRLSPHPACRRALPSRHASPWSSSCASTRRPLRMPLSAPRVLSARAPSPPFGRQPPASSVPRGPPSRRPRPRFRCRCPPPPAVPPGPMSCAPWRPPSPPPRPPRRPA
mmetsp:Transcript_72281/g.190580  ORF Transcript_72281/g.190580 Transcript_72281/m.190580 type:complete len:272 (+) Transcript_72281:173-988(+)